MKTKITLSVFGLILIAAYAWFFLPPLNLHSKNMWLITIFALSIITIAIAVARSFGNGKGRAINISFLILLIAAIVIFLIGSVMSSAFANSGAYARVLEIEEKDISEYDISLEEAPLMDKATAQMLASRNLGTLTDLVSQFELDDYNNSQINYNGIPTRVAPIDYSGIIKYFTNRSDGIPGYIQIDMQTQQTEFVEVPDGIHYSPGSLGFHDLERHVWLNYPTRIIDSYTFEIDDNQHPYWLMRCATPQAGLFGARDITSILLVDAVTGEITEYQMDEIPEWIDMAHAPTLVVEQYDWYGKFQNGWLNSMFGQKGVTQTTEGYNYLAHDNDVYLYTGVTSVLSDKSNLGFITVNMRTKETVYYEYPSAQESSAAASAQGQVQQYNYTATFPNLVNVAGVPTYVTQLKDNSGLVKMYGMINAAQYQLVAVENSLNDTIESYVALLDSNNIQHEGQDKVTEVATGSDGEVVAEPIITEEISGKVTDIKTTNISGTTHYFIKLDSKTDSWFEIVPTETNVDIVFVDIGSTVSLDYAPTDKQVMSAELN